jgi:predicted alpha/beta hydrolase family esterase
MILTVPGLYDSGPDHWQTRWEQELPQCRRVLQKDWQAPARRDWVDAIETAVHAAAPPVYVAAHSLGCIAIAYWVQQTRLSIAGALLVAPADVEREGFPAGATGFRPLPTRRLPFPSIVAASEDDPWITLERSAAMARDWGSRFVNVGKAGHIAANVGADGWPGGKSLLQALMNP